MIKHRYKNLKIGQLGFDMANEVFLLMDDIPAEERFGLISQLSPCSVSILSNISNGSGRSDKSFSHFNDVALGSSLEIETQ